MKPFRALTWPDAASADWAFVQQCTEGDDQACTRLVTDHQRMVFQLALHLLGNGYLNGEVVRLDGAQRFAPR